MELLVVIDMQKDFLTGVLGNPETAAVLGSVCQRVRDYRSRSSVPVVYTMDTHGSDYMDTQEGRKLPVPHCIEGTPGWELPEELAECIGEDVMVTKPTFGAKELPAVIEGLCKGTAPEKITLCGVCTDICVISNAMLLKAFFPETVIEVAADCCAGTTPDNHRRALEAMQGVQIEVR